jgi:CoA:oxalate CoA-transferase
MDWRLMAAQGPRPLDGIRVVGLEQYMAGPYCTLLLADSGAEVIKIERPGVGDPRRAMPPFAEKDGVKKAAGFMGYNRNKKSVALDMSKPEGREVLRRLAGAADVLVDNLRPGAMDRMGMGYETLNELNARLVYASISGFGRQPGFEGPYGDRPAFDIVSEAMSGVMNLVGFEDKPPSWTIYGLADVYSGMVTAFGVMQALFQRERTGQGQWVDSAMYDNMLGLNEAMIALYSVTGQSNQRGVPKNVYPRGAYQTKDGYVALNVPDNRIWQRLAEMTGHPELADDERTKDGVARSTNRDFVDGIIESWLAGLGRDEAVDILNDGGVPAGPVNTAEDVFNCPQVAAREMLLPVDDPEVGEYAFARTPPRLSGSPMPPAEAPPKLGQHTRPVLEELLGYSSAEVDALVDQGIVETA